MSSPLPFDSTVGQTAPVNTASTPPTWADALEQVMQQDREFLQQHANQEYYVRPIASVEVLEAQAMGRQVTEETLMLVGEVAPGCRTRLPFPPDANPPLEQFKAMQRQIRKQLGAMPTSKAAPKTNVQGSVSPANKSRQKPRGFG